jgi:hypothetical protein
MHNPNECIICGRKTEQDEHFVEIDDGFVCGDCVLDLKEIRGEFLFGQEQSDGPHEGDH